MKYPEGRLLVRIINLPETAQKLGVSSLDHLATIDVYRHLNAIIALYEKMGIPLEELEPFYDDLAQNLEHEYQLLVAEPDDASDLPTLKLPDYDRWMKDILEATYLSHTAFHERRLSLLRKLNEKTRTFLDTLISSPATPD